MTDITIIGTGKMARGLAAHAAAESPSRSWAETSTKQPDSPRSSTPPQPVLPKHPPGGLSCSRCPFTAAKEVVTRFGDAPPAGRVVVDISTPANYETLDSLVIAPGSSTAEEIAALTPADVVKALNTTFSSALAAGRVAGQSLDVFIAGDSTEVVSAIAEFATAAGMRPISVGGLHHTRELEGVMLLVMGMQANPDLPDFNWNTALKVLV